MRSEPSSTKVCVTVGPETVNHKLEPGDRLRLDYTMGSVVAVHRLVPGA